MAWDDLAGSGVGGAWMPGVETLKTSTINKIRENFLLLKSHQYTGTNSPEGVVTAPIGSTFRRTNGVAGAALYVKESGTGNTGWKAMKSALVGMTDDANSTAAKTIDWATGNHHIVTLTANVTFTFTNPVGGELYRLVTIQDATGGRTITWPGTVLWSAGSAPAPTATAAKMDWWDFIYLPTQAKYLGRASQNY